MEEREDKLSKQRKKFKKLKALFENEPPERYVAGWLRTASTNLYTRRQIIDTKSGLLITVNSIILSVLLGSLYPRLADDPHLIWGLSPMVIANVLSIAFAIIATRPKIASGAFYKEALKNRTAPLMTFDNFYSMPQKEYMEAVRGALKDSQYLQDTFLMDIYNLGVDLASRYRNLRIAYHVFMAGLIVSITVFGMCHLFFN